MQLPGADAYRKGLYKTIPGWFWPEDFDLFDRILNQQLDDDIVGDALEIGCYHGKSAILIGLGLRQHEYLTVCDLFGAPVDTAENSDSFEPGFGLDTFLTNYTTVLQKRPVIKACSSLDLKFGSGFRFIHVDGGHSQQVASHDIDTAVTYCTMSGVIAIDDYRTHHTPGVPAAIWAATANKDLFPFALSETKVYACPDALSHAHWLDVARGWNLPDSEEHNIFGTTVLRTTRGRNL